MRTQIFTSVVNRPEFLALQKKLFDLFLEHDYQFNVVDDSIDDLISNQFEKIAQDNNICYYKKPKIGLNLNPAEACAEAIQWTYDNIILKEHGQDLVLFLDSDMFLVDDFNIIEYLEDKIICGCPQIRGHVKYIWNGLMFFNMPKIMSIDANINFNWGYVDGHLTDVGGNTWHYFVKNKIEFTETDVQYPIHFNDIELQNKEVTKGYNFELHLDGKFLHYRAATNWHSNWRGFEDPLKQKTETFNKIISNILANGQK
jgi:hypothetical protein